MFFSDTVTDKYLNIKTKHILEAGRATDVYVVGSKSFRPDKLFKVTKIKQLCYFST